MSRSSVCLQDFCLGLVKPRQRNSHPGLTLECWCPSAQSPRSASTFQICCAVLSIPKSSRTSQRSRLWLGSSNLAESSSHVLLGAVLLLPKSFQVMGRERSGGKTSAQSVQRIIGISGQLHLMDEVDAALERKQRRWREGWVMNYSTIRENVEEGILKVRTHRNFQEQHRDQPGPVELSLPLGGLGQGGLWRSIPSQISRDSKAVEWEFHPKTWGMAEVIQHFCGKLWDGLWIYYP